VIAKRQKKYKSEVLRQELLTQIFSGELEVGVQLAPVRELCEKYGLSYVTVVNIIQKLCKDGYLKSHQGKGTVVKSANPESEISKKSCRILIFEPVISERMWTSFLKAMPDICDFYPKFVLHYKSLLEQENLDFHPDFIYTSDGLVKTMASRGILAPLDNSILKTAGIKLDDYDPKILEMLSFNGQLFALPFCFSNLGLFYNKDIFDKAGLKYPSTEWKWADLLSAAEKLTVKQKNGRIQHYGFLSGFTKSNIMSFYMQGLPPELALDNALKSKRHIDGFRFFLEMLNIRHTAPFLQSGSALPVELFLEENAAMVIYKYSMTRMLSGNKFRWGVAPLPAGNRKHSECAVQGFGISKTSELGIESGHILKKLCGKEMQDIALRNFGHLPAYIKSAIKLPHSDAFISQLPYSQNIFLNFAENEPKIINLLYKMLIGLILPEDIIGEFAKMQKEAVEGNKKGGTI